MRLYTVLLRPDGRAEAALERAVFVRDGFHFWAFLLGPLWCLWHGLWLAALAVIVLSGALIAIGAALQLSPEMQFLPQLVLAIIVGLEAGNLRRFGLRRRGFLERGSVAARDLAEAEAIFFADAASPGPGPGPEPQPPAQPATPQPGFSKSGARDEEVVGLFPEYRGR